MLARRQQIGLRKRFASTRVSVREHAGMERVGGCRCVLCVCFSACVSAARRRDCVCVDIVCAYAHGLGVAPIIVVVR